MLFKKTILAFLVFAFYAQAEAASIKMTPHKVEVLAQSGKEFMSLYNRYMDVYSKAMELEDYIDGARSGDIQKELAYQKIEYLIVKIKSNIENTKSRLEAFTPPPTIYPKNSKY